MEAIINFFTGTLNTVAWLYIFLPCTIVGGLYLTIRNRGIQFTRFGYAMKNTVGKMFQKQEAGAGAGTPLQAVTTALAATVGTGNIVGTSQAIALGGYGAVFWLWLAALLGMMIKYSEVTLSIQYRERDAKGDWVGGPMYYVKNGLSKHWQWVGILFCVFAAIASFGIGMSACLCVLCLKVPFRAPLCPPKFSLDRFWLPNGWLMFLQTIPVAAVTGILLGTIHRYEFYVFIMVGFCLALLALHFVFLNADIRSEIVSGNILWAAGLLLLIFREGTPAFYASSILIGMGIGLTVARLLVFFIKLSHHCERGSANTSYMFAWELGIGLGLFLGYTGFPDPLESYWVCLWILAGALVFYLLLTHRWFMAHKVR